VEEADVVGSGGAELAVQEVEEARVTQVDPRPVPVEVRKSDEKICHRDVLAAEQIGEMAGQDACVCHVNSVARAPAEYRRTPARRRPAHGGRSLARHVLRC